MKKIVIDARESGTSTGRYVDKLIEYLAKLTPGFEIVVLTKPARVNFIKSIAPNFEVIESNIKEFTFSEQLALKKQIEKLTPDLVHFTMVQQPVLYPGKVVTTMHDLTTCRFKNPDKNPIIFTVKQQIYKWVNKKVARKSATIITPSSFVKNDVVGFTSVNADKITVTYEAADKINEQPQQVNGLAGIKFIMYVGRPTPHKNLEKLVEAFTELTKTNGDLWLALAGKKDANYLRIEDKVNKTGVKNVIFTDFVNEGELRWMYENCATYVFPSLSEGFGLPGLEAMAHGAPVVSSSATCLPEIYGEAAHYFDPTDVKDMATKINEVLSDETLRKKLTATGKKQVNKYSWEKMAAETIEIYKQGLS